ncbi:hypothetical protein COT64_00250 [Candidatus Shapirobacteria bacterium CG09_land_8_20_14_0_10_39_12]|uniref:2-oxoacid:acceptor oxidoreductase subunit alpha n=1 Tax=Candidatus Shapirobacteria bacterium CG09_land_8_20_14_0_10_39_12 TaxID=1974885 RepID=A0A2H0WSL7_9BACT|nr:MAG: hypothetical protein COT64_00250 [Candidatus Shapirobacteria bacterium CG09_land_8_20_14_0_10_39_12]
MKSFAVKLSGPAGAGMMQAGETLSKALNRLGFYTLMYPEYPSRIRGGDNCVLVVFSNEKYLAPVEKIDFLLAFGKDNYQKHQNESNREAKGFEAEELGLIKIAGELGNPLVANTAGLGFIFRSLGFEPKVLKEQVEEEFKDKEAIKKLNLEALKRGYELGRKQEFNFPENIKQKQKILNYSGNEALVEGVFRGDCEFASIYPMTPINSILTMLSRSKVQMFRPEDEIAGMMSSLGASYAGKKAMVATSGGGFCLMVEGLGMAGMAEIPVVCIVGQRTGPSTGMATFSSQADLNFVTSAGHGEFPRIVLAPGDLGECQRLGEEAFYLAEKYQVPVILLTDKYLAESRFSADEKDFKETELKEKTRKASGLEDYKRYRFTQSGVSPRAFPGQLKVMANSYEHDETGFSSDDKENRIKMMNKRMGKLKNIDSVLPGFEKYGPAFAKASARLERKKILVGWGSTKEIILDFLKANAEFDFLHIYRPWPFPKEAVKILKKYDEVIAVEGNYSGQLADLIEQFTLRKVKRVLKDDGRPFFKQELEKLISK